MPSAIYSPEALVDLKEIFTYVSQYSRSAAEKLKVSLSRSIRLLISHPKWGEIEADCESTCEVLLLVVMSYFTSHNL